MIKDDAITFKEAAALKGVTYRSIKRWVKREQLLLLRDPTHPQRKLIRVKDLPPATQQQWRKEKMAAEIEAEVPEPVESILTLRNTSRSALLPFPAPVRGLTGQESKLALERYRIIEPILNGDWQEAKGQWLSGRREIRNKQDYVVWLAEQHGLAPSTLWEWRKRHMEQGPRGLLRKRRSDQGVSRVLSEEDRAQIESLYLASGSARAVWREFQQQTGRRIGYHVVLGVTRSIPQPVKDRALRGAKYFNDRHMGYISPNYDKLKPNDVWVFDHTQFDLFVNAWGRAARPWLTAIMDKKSRYILGWCVSLQPDSLTIASALRMAVLEGGVPQAVHIDNGKDFRSNYLSGPGRRIGRIDLPREARGLFQQIRPPVRIIYATPYHPQAKSIERWFRTLHGQFDSGWNSYCGDSPQNRPETCQPLLDEHEDCMHAGNPDGSPLPRIEELAFGFGAWLAEDYHEQPHKGRGMRNRSPAQVYRPSGLRVEEGQLDVLLMKHEQRKVIREAVQLFDRRYEHEGHGLFLHNGHLADIAYDPFGRALPDMTQVVVSCCGQRYLCRHLGEPETYEELQDRLRERRQLKRAVERYIIETHRRAAIQSPGERRQQAAEAAMPAGLDPRAKARALKSAVDEGDPPDIDSGDVALPDYGRHADEMMGG
jgi:transposase InsO family protein